jgi:hypothetical protein
MGCNNKIKHTCGDSIKLECADYEGTTNIMSVLKDESCISGEDAVQDIYNQLEEINVADISNCLTYTQTSGKVPIKTAVKKHGQEICEIKQQLENIKSEAFLDLDISNSSIDFKCLETDCGDEIQTLRDWIIAVTNKICTP